MNLKEKLKLISNPKRFLTFLKIESIKYIYYLTRPKYNLLNDMNWDNLIILDACRYDMFAKYNHILGKLSKVISVASCTWDWAKINFSDCFMNDVIYISSNPFISYYYLRKNIGHIPFYKIIELWKNNWSENLKTVHPLDVNQETLKTLKKYPFKRYIIHYLQPHHPFIGDIKFIDTNAVDFSKALGQPKTESMENDVFNQLKKRKTDINIVWRCYISNLVFVLRYVEKLLPFLKGKTCITSDHGNSFGRYNLFYGHPQKTYLPELIEVPWLETYS